MGITRKWLPSVAVAAALLRGFSGMALAHDLPNYPDLGARLRDLSSVTSDPILLPGENRLEARTFPVDPMSLSEVVGGLRRAIVFHQHFQNAENSGSMDGTLLFCVFHGPGYAGPPERQVHPPQLTDPYRSPSAEPTQLSLRIPDFSMVDLGRIRDAEWVYAYVIINDEGVGAPSGGDVINRLNINFPPALRAFSADIPEQGSKDAGQTIASVGHFEGAPSATTPVGVSASLDIGIEINFGLSGGGEGCIPNRIPEPGETDCNPDPGGYVSDVVFLTSPFGPGVVNVSILGGGESASATNEIALGPVSFPNFRCEGIEVVHANGTGIPIRVGDPVRITVTVSNPCPSAPPPYRGAEYRETLPGGTLGGLARVGLNVTGGSISGIGGPKTVFLDAVPVCEYDPPGEVPAARRESVEFTGTFMGPGTTVVEAVVLATAPYTTVPPFSCEPDLLPPDDCIDGRFRTLLDFECEARIVVTDLKIEKYVQRLCVLDPDAPNDVRLEPSEPATEVEAPRCGRVRFTLEVCNLTTGEGLTEVRVTDCLPPGLSLVAGSISDPSITIGPAGEGVPCEGLPSHTPIVFRLPDLASMGEAGDRVTFTFDALVATDSPLGRRDNQAFAKAVGAEFGEVVIRGPSRADVLVPLVATNLQSFDPVPAATCPGKTVRFSWRLTNTGNWPLDDVTIGAVVPENGLTIVSQTPPPGTLAATLDPGEFVDIEVVAMTQAGEYPTRRCVTLSVSAFPDCVARRDAGACRIEITPRGCVDVYVPMLNVTCLDETIPLVDPGTEVTRRFRVTNNGNRAFDRVDFTCDALPDDKPGDLTIVECPARITNLAVGASVDVSLRVRASDDGSDRQCAQLEAAGVAAGLVDCNAVANATCCIDVRPIVVVQKAVQFVCFPDPENPGIEELRPATPAPSVETPQCGTVRFTIRVRNASASESLTNVRLSDCLPSGLTFIGNVTPATPIGLPGEGPGCAGTGATSETVFRIPDLAKSGDVGDRYEFTFDARVDRDAVAAPHRNFARARGVGSCSSIRTNVSESTADVTPRRVAGSFVGLGVEPPRVCAGEDVTFRYRFTNDGDWPLRPVVSTGCELSPGLIPLTETPEPNVDLGPLQPGESIDVTVTVKTQAGIPASTQCVTCAFVAMGECTDPRAGMSCRIEPRVEQCVDVVTAAVAVECATSRPQHVPGDVATFSFDVTNVGSESLDGALLTCAVSGGLELLSCPPDMPGPIAPGTITRVDVVVRVIEKPTSLSRITVTAQPLAAGFPAACLREDSASCEFSTRVPALGALGVSVLAAFLGVLVLRRARRLPMTVS